MWNFVQVHSNSAGSLEPTSHNMPHTFSWPFQDPSQPLTNLSPTFLWPRQALHFFYYWRQPCSSQQFSKYSSSPFLPCQVERLQSQGLTSLSLALEPFPSFWISAHYVDHLVLGSAFIPQVPFSLLASSRYLSHPISSHLLNKLLTIIPDFNSQLALKPFNTPAVMKSRIRRWGRRFGWAVWWEAWELVPVLQLLHSWPLRRQTISYFLFIYVL